VLAGILSLGAPAFAQTATPSQEPETTVEEIVVTGSRIRRDPASVPTPIITVEREALLETGLTTVIDYLATIPALSNSLVPSDTTAGLNQGGLDFANLRSLGSQRTLTLIDGRRQVGSSAGQLAVDVSSIPRLLIQNIDIVTGGASSVYGADAVSGVLNYTLRRDFEGLEIDANYGETVQKGESSTRRISALIGQNFFDDRLNLYAHGEFEQADAVFARDINWLASGRIVLGIDADPTDSRFGLQSDGFVDNAVFFNARRLDRPQWGSTTLANMQRPSPVSDPDIPFANCPGFSTSGNCFNVDPSYTYWFDGTTARLANFGQRIGSTGANRPWNIGGDGEPANLTSFDTLTLFPEQEAQRYQVGANFQLTDAISATLQAKYVNEDTFIVTQKSFWDIFIVDSGLSCGGTPFGVAARTCNNGLTPGLIGGTSSFATRTDNAFLPVNLRNAIRTNTFQRFLEPSQVNIDQFGQPVAGPLTSAPIANHRGFGIDRTQSNEREVQQYVAALNGNYDRLAFVDNFSWNLSYTYGEMNNLNFETGPDAIRFGHALDSVVDTAGIVNGRPGEIVCRVRLLSAQGIAIQEQNPFTPQTVYTDAATNPEIAGCVPLNVFGAGNQSAEGLDYISTGIRVIEKNTQENLLGSISGQLWDFWGAGPIGIALGAEYRREYTEAVGRSADTNNRLLQLNTGPDFLGAEYETKEGFAELAIPLLQDSRFGQYAELSGSYRYFDYSTSGTGDVYGVNLIYRPVSDITFKTSFNTSFRAPNLTENFRPLAQTFVNPPFSDPCDTRVIAAFSGDNAAEIRANRIRNCTLLAAQRGLTFDFAQTTATTADDFRPTYGSGIASSLGGNQSLRPETSESFTFSTVLRPRWVPNLAIVLDYYEITIDDVIVTPGGQAIAENCVNGPELNPVTCSLVFRNNPNNDADPFNNFKIGAPVGDPVGGLILQSLNFAKLETRGLDLQVNYGFESADLFGRDFGRFNYSLGGLWLIDQKNFTNLNSPNFFSDLTTSVFYPRFEGVSRLTWQPDDRLAITWTADFMVAQDLVDPRNQVASGNIDTRPFGDFTTGNFVRHDFTVRYELTDSVTLRAGVTNAFDAEPGAYTGFASTFDPYGRRYNVGLNWRAF